MIRALTIVALVGAVVSVVAVKASGPLRARNWHWPPNVTVMGDSDGPSITLDDNEPVSTRQIPWQGSSALVFQLPAEITYTQGPTASILVTGPTKLIDRLRMKDNALSLDGSVHGMMHHNLKVAITAPAVSRFELEAAQSLDIRNYSTDALDIEIEGAGRVSAQGTTRNLKLAIEGAGDATLDMLTATDAHIEIDGLGNVVAGPTGDASVEINGAGHVRLTRTPAHLHQEVNGAGSITAPPAAAGTNL